MRVDLAISIKFKFLFHSSHSLLKTSQMVVSHPSPTPGTLDRTTKHGSRGLLNEQKAIKWEFEGERHEMVNFYPERKDSRTPKYIRNKFIYYDMK